MGFKQARLGKRNWCISELQNLKVGIDPRVGTSEDPRVENLIKFEKKLRERSEDTVDSSNKGTHHDDAASRKAYLRAVAEQSKKLKTHHRKKLKNDQEIDPNDL